MTAPIIDNAALIPDDPRIANRPGNPNWKGVANWLDEAAAALPIVPAGPVFVIPPVVESTWPEWDAEIEDYVCFSAITGDHYYGQSSGQCLENRHEAERVWAEHHQRSHNVIIL